METIDCWLCHRTENTIIYSGLNDRLLNGREPLFSLVRCANCGLIYQNPRPTPEEISDYYPENYDSYNSSEQRKNPSWFLKNANDYGLKKRSRFITRYKAGGSLLDIGCASGTFLNFMGQSGQWQLQGIEISPYASEIARKQYGLDVFTGTLEETHFPDQFFDVITLWEVLEHLYNPLTTMIETNRLLKKDGILVIRVPNGASLDAKLFKRHWEGLDPPRHLTVFTPKTLNQLFNKSNYRAIHWNTSSGNIMAFLLSMRFWLSAQPFSDQKKRAIFSFLYHPMIRIMLAPLFLPAEIFHYGPHLVVTVKKST